MTASTRLGGHIVQGHVDAVGTIASREPQNTGTSSGSLPPAVTRYLVEKGSVTVDGVSLTVTAADDAGFAVSLIPETLRRTTLGRRAVVRRSIWRSTSSPSTSKARLRGCSPAALR